jgi:hypothetical protein
VTESEPDAPRYGRLLVGGISTYFVFMGAAAIGICGVGSLLFFLYGGAPAAHDWLRNTYLAVPKPIKDRFVMLIIVLSATLGLIASVSWLRLLRNRGFLTETEFKRLLGKGRKARRSQR